MPTYSEIQQFVQRPRASSRRRRGSIMSRLFGAYRRAGRRRPPDHDGPGGRRSRIHSIQQHDT